MIIDLTKSELFTVEPDIRFSIQHNFDKGVWKEVWRRYKFLDYTFGDLREYLFIKTGKYMPSRKIKRWIIRTEIYGITYPVLKRGATHVNTEIFGGFEDIVIDELTKNIKASGTGDSRIIL